MAPKTAIDGDQPQGEDAGEMVGDGYKYRVENQSNDHKYFIITPRIIKAFSRTPYDLALWDTIKDIAGESGECYLSTQDLATLSDMSTGQVSKSRRHWLDLGFLKGGVRRDPGYPQPVWHLMVPDIWEENIKWCEKHPKIYDRLEHKKSLHQVKPSLGEGGTTPGEGGTTPGETKKIDKKNQKEEPSGRQLDLVDGYLALSQSPGIKRMARVSAIQSYLGEVLIINSGTKRWEDFAKYVDDQQQQYGQKVEVFIRWLKGKKDFDMQFWSPAKMREMWPQAFCISADEGAISQPQPSDEELERIREKARKDFAPLINQVSQEQQL